MAKRDIVVVGASAGGIQATRGLLAQLPPDLPAAVFVVIHIPAERPSTLPAILGKACALPVRHARHLEPIRPGAVYVAPPNFHLVLSENAVRLGRGPRENGHRPAADPLFRTAARAHGGRLIGVVLSGALDDGAAGLAWVHEQGGVTVVQDPADAPFPDMPANALRSAAVDHVVPVSEMGLLLSRLVREEVPWEEEVIMEMDDETREPDRAEGVPSPGPRAADLAEANSVYTCPECAGALWRVEAGEQLTRYECRVGHAYSTESLLENQAEVLESAFWTVLRNLGENASLLRRSRDRALERGHTRAAAHYGEQIQLAEKRIAIVRRALLGKEFTLGPPATGGESGDFDPDFKKPPLT